MIKMTEKNQKEIVTKRNQELLNTSGLDKDEILALQDTCVGLAYNEKNEDCKNCGNDNLCKDIEAKLKELFTGKEESKKAKKVEPKKETAEKEIEKELKKEVKKEEPKKEKKEVSKVENKEEVKVIEKAKTTVVDAVTLKYDYNKVSGDDEVIKTIKMVTKDIKRSQNNIVSSMIEMGEMLNRMRVMIKNNWLEWLAVELDMSAQQAYSSINVWKRFGKKMNQISDKISYTTLGHLASDTYTDEEIDGVIKAVNHEKIKGTLSDIQSFVKDLRMKEMKNNNNQDHLDDEEDEKPATKKDKKIDNKIDISEEEVSFVPFIAEAEAFLKLLESTATVSEVQFSQLKKIKDITKSIAEELELKLTEVKM
jgi:hypothetical protein